MATVISGLQNSTGLRLGVGALGTRIAAYLAHRRERARVLNELQRCDYRELRDMNISPYDFAAIADGSFRR